MSNVDLFATLIDVSNANVDFGDGNSLLPLLTGRGSATLRDYVVSEFQGKQGWLNPGRMIRTKDCKLIKWRGMSNELYDLQNDPWEQTNLSGDPS